MYSKIIVNCSRFLFVTFKYQAENAGEIVNDKAKNVKKTREKYAL